MAIYGVLLIFNEDYRLSSINAFKRFMNSIGSECKILIVNNNHSNIKNGEIPGDNTNWEFSGWDKGISSLDIKDGDVVVFANDTFRHHRSWGRYDQWRFKKAIIKLSASNEQGICGEVHKFSGIYQVLGVRSDRWVCTYLFALTGGVINKLNKVSLDESSLSGEIISINNEKIVWGGGVSLNLQTRIQKWLYPPGGVLGWRKSHSSNDAIKLRKAKTILNEKWLSAYCSSNGITIIDAGPDVITKRYRNTKYRFSEVINKFKVYFLTTNS